MPNVAAVPGHGPHAASGLNPLLRGGGRLQQAPWVPGHLPHNGAGQLQVTVLSVSTAWRRGSIANVLCVYAPCSTTVCRNAATASQQTDSQH